MDNEKPTAPTGPTAIPSQQNPPVAGPSSQPQSQPVAGPSNPPPASPNPSRPVSFAQGPSHFVPTPILTSPPQARIVSTDDRTTVPAGGQTQRRYGSGDSNGKAPSTDPGNGIDPRRMTPLPPLPSRGSPVIHESPQEEMGPAMQDLGRMNTMNTINSRTSRRSNIDWIVPQLPASKEAREVAFRPKTVGERLDPTLQHAYSEKNKYAAKARLTGIVLNVAIGKSLSLTLRTRLTCLSAVTTDLYYGFRVRWLPLLTGCDGFLILYSGGLSTLVASYLARARGSGEPELSITRTKDLEQFIREAEAFKMDFGHEHGHEHDSRLDYFRDRFEDLLGNASGNDDARERKLATPV
ncbi:hypothetical protein VNI00_011383 [Paramarasmius palmivorus]|uniref:SMODS and SLOG-associating 2TM effector domain-containing protein n=1 Tax=Paramarasmius palmivorus TaxID=297713 RepID=A0AAW0CDK9_9AGAR